MSPAPLLVEAAGGVLWRRVSGTEDIEVALVHRPGHGDWSLPKGKLEPGEHALLGALREIAEETGFAATPGRPLGELRYVHGVRAKRVRYWACRARAGAFTPGDEVDELAWLPVADAMGMLPDRRDRPVLERFAADLRDTRALVVVRHASAGDRDAWDGADRDRPLDDRGRGQADALAVLLQAYDVRRAVAADVVRCRDTLAPFAAAASVPLDLEPALTAGRFETDPSAGVAVAVALAARGASVLCTQREVIEDLVTGVCQSLGHRAAPNEVGPVAKGSMVVLHVEHAEDGRAGPSVVAREHLSSG